MSTDMQTAVKSDQSKLKVNIETGEETIEYIDNPNILKIETLSTEEQRKLLEKYGGDKISQALGKFNLQSLNELQKEDLENFEKELESLWALNL